MSRRRTAANTVTSERWGLRPGAAALRADFDGAVKANWSHVIYLDRVRSTFDAPDRQHRIAVELTRFIDSLEMYRQARANGHVIPLDSGDGLALVFTSDPRVVASIGCAIAEYGNILKDVALRIGIHSGTVTVRTDLAAKENVTGAGIDVAARLQSVAPPGGILLSDDFARHLIPFGDWRNRLIDEGVREAKHGLRIKVFSLQGFEGQAPHDTKRKRKLALLFGRSKGS